MKKTKFTMKILLFKIDIKINLKNKELLIFYNKKFKINKLAN